ncbi:hypothetical protein [Microbacterium sp.]|uniref:hypothetical protein n=1 Tax=Microbacterium sp. TaxID=51671 RepID=UPI0039E530FC
MRWERFFDDLEGQLDAEWEAERAALDTEAERLRLSRLTLRERLAGLVRACEAVSVELSDGTVLTGAPVGVGADWMALEAALRRGGAVLVPLGGVVAIGMPHADLLRSARPAASGAGLSERMTLGFVLRDLVRKRIPVTVGCTGGRTFAGTMDRAGADHLDLALHELGAPRRREAVTGHRVVPFAAIGWVRLEAPVALP